MSFRELLKKLYHDENGVVVSAEVVLVTTILVLGSIVGLSQLHYAVNNELNDMANAVSAYDSYGDAETFTLTDSDGVPEVSGDGY